MCKRLNLEDFKYIDCELGNLNLVHVQLDLARIERAQNRQRLGASVSKVVRDVAVLETAAPGEDGEGRPVHNVLVLVGRVADLDLALELGHQVAVLGGRVQLEPVLLLVDHGKEHVLGDVSVGEVVAAVRVVEGDHDVGVGHAAVGREAKGRPDGVLDLDLEGHVRLVVVPVQDVLVGLDEHDAVLEALARRRWGPGGEGCYDQYC